MILLTNQSIEEKLSESAATIALHTFHWHYATLVLFNSTMICSIDTFLRSYEKNVYIGRGKFYPGFAKRMQQFVIFGVDLPDITDILSWMQKHQLDNTGRYIVICQSLQWVMCNEDDLVNILWRYKIVDVVLINTRKGKPVNGFIYDYPEDCKNPHPMNLENWDSCLLNGREHCVDFYPLKLKNLHECPVIVSTFNQVPYMNISNGTPTGIDGDLLRFMAAAMNFSLVIMTPRIGNGWGKVEDNGTWSGSLADVYNDWANFSMTFGCVTMIRFNNFQISTTYALITIGWVTHPSKILPSSLKLFRPFQPGVRFALCITFVIVVFIKVCLKSSLLSPLRYKLNIILPDNSLFHAWEICMGLPVRSFPSNKSLLCLAVIWIWYCYLIRTLYQVYLINSLQTDVYDPEINTIEEAISSKYSFGGGLALRDYYVDDAFIFDEWQNVESVDIHPTMVKLTGELKFVLAMNTETTKMYLKSNPDKELHILPRVVVTSPTAMFFKKYSPLVKAINAVLFRLAESGIIHKTYMDYTNKKVLNEDQGNIPISMVHYTGCYVILMIGWFLSTLCFVVEKLTKKNKFYKKGIFKSRDKTSYHSKNTKNNKFKEATR